MWNKFPFVYQKDQMDCGPACLQMVSEYHGKSTQLEYLRKQSYITREGVSLKGLIHAAEKIGFRTIPVKLGMESLNVDRPGLQDAPLPCIVHWEQNHFVVVHK
ncbi:MAG: cysteine peptidase family C39 domain-containing protein, partial [Bacteroidota bacterium]